VGVNVLLQYPLYLSKMFLVSCADYTNEDSCESGQGLGSSNCMWRHVINSKSNFSTCAPNNECGNMECSELETLHGSICPQDCLGMQLHTYNLCLPIYSFVLPYE